MDRPLDPEVLVIADRHRPIALAGVIVWSAGHSLNMINLFGLILVLGIVVDDAIVVGEAIFLRRTQGDGPLRAATRGPASVISNFFQCPRLNMKRLSLNPNLRLGSHWGLPSPSRCHLPA